MQSKFVLFSFCFLSFFTLYSFLFENEGKRDIQTSEVTVNSTNKVTNINIKGIDYLQVLVFIIEPRALKFGMRM